LVSAELLPLTVEQLSSQKKNRILSKSLAQIQHTHVLRRTMNRK